MLLLLTFPIIPGLLTTRCCAHTLQCEEPNAGWVDTAVKLLDTAKSIDKRVWFDQHPLMQLVGDRGGKLTPDVVKLLARPAPKTAPWFLQRALLDAKAHSRATLSLRYERLRAACCPRLEEKEAEIRPKRLWQARRGAPTIPELARMKDEEIESRLAALAGRARVRARGADVRHAAVMLPAPLWAWIMGTKASR